MSRVVNYHGGNVMGAIGDLFPEIDLSKYKSHFINNKE